MASSIYLFNSYTLVGVFLVILVLVQGSPFRKTAGETGTAIQGERTQGAENDCCGPKEYLGSEAYDSAEDFYYYYYGNDQDFITDDAGKIVDCRQEPMHCYELQYRSQLVVPDIVVKPSDVPDATTQASTTAYWKAFSPPQIQIEWVSFAFSIKL